MPSRRDIRRNCPDFNTSCRAAIALAPMLFPILAPARARASILFGFDEARIDNADFRNQGYGGSASITLPANRFLFSATQLANGGTHISGLTQSLSRSELGNGNNLRFRFFGDFSGSFDADDAIHFNLDFTATASGGDLSFVGYTVLAPGFPFDNTVTPITSGTPFQVAAQSVIGYSSNGQGEWLLAFGIHWTGGDPTDTFTLTIPNESLDLWIGQVPEPMMATMLVLPTIFIRRDRRPVAVAVCD